MSLWLLVLVHATNTFHVHFCTVLLKWQSAVTTPTWPIETLHLKPSDDGVEMVEIFSDDTDNSDDTEPLDTMPAIVQDVTTGDLNALHS